jgi:hypothetical protein
MSKRAQLFCYYAVVGFLIVKGLQNVAQSGQGIGVVQNDGYTVSGGIMFLIAGILIGYDLGRRKMLKRKSANAKK